MPTETEITAVAVEVAKIALKPGDVLILKVPLNSMNRAAAIAKSLEINNQIVVLPNDVEILALSQE